MTKYYVIEPLRYGVGDVVTDYAPGDTIDLEATVAHGLIGQGALLDQAAFKAAAKAKAEADAAPADGGPG